jgi:TatA/E family protein of Tat protein translocase
MFSGYEWVIVAGAAVMLFGGGTKLREMARGMGAATREFKAGQAEADVEAERARAQARALAETNAGTTEPPAPPQ